MSTRTCQNCKNTYEVPEDKPLRITCPHCGTRLYTLTGTRVPIMAEFHTEQTQSDDPRDWKLGDFAQLIMESGQIRLDFDLELTMRTLSQRPEWPTIKTLHQQWSRHKDSELEEALNINNRFDRIYQLNKIFNHLRATFYHINWLGIPTWAKLEEYVKKPYEIQRNHSIGENFEYRRELNEAGEAVGMNIPMVVTGRRLIITGKLDKPRAEYQKLIEQAGGINVTTVSQADYLVIGENHVQKISNKAKLAQAYDVPVVTLESLKKALSTISKQPSPLS